jgi:hypothetical protein
LNLFLASFSAMFVEFQTMISSQSIEVPECFVEQSDVQVVDGEDIPMNDPIASLGSSSGVIDTFVLREY